jgi:hypothetical protein
MDTAAGCGVRAMETDEHEHEREVVPWTPRPPTCAAVADVGEGARP